MTSLVLGGTAEARALARALVDRELPVISSLAGRVSAPALPVGEVRIGGFGGAAGLASFLQSRQITQLVDATHPFAAQMSAHAARAARDTGVPLVRLARPGWADHPAAPGWTWVPDLAAARAAAEALGQRPFLTTGRQSLSVFAAFWTDRYTLVRLVEPPELPLPAPWHAVYSRGPYSLDAERRLLCEQAIEVLVTKDSGGAYTVAKLDAAAELGVPVVVLRRPPPEPGVPQVTDVAGALRWLGARPDSPDGRVRTTVRAECDRPGRSSQ